MDIDNLYQDTEAYRDSISTIDDKGKRVWVYPKKPKGRFYNARSILSVLFLILLFGMPFIKFNGEPIMMFNVLERRFIVWGILFTQQDFYLFALALLTFMVFIVLFTVVFGRLFCGWVCPQTVFMEMIFRRIEYWIEGDGNEQRKLANGPWTGAKIMKRVTKHVIFFAIAVLIANTFLSYIIGVDAVEKIIMQPIEMHRGGFIAMLIFSFVFYFVFAYMREQVCLVVCPYGRLQGVLLDRDSIVVAYDQVRGEPRGKIRKHANPMENIDSQIKLGDCIDCKLCVHVCPTAIDIRNGTQLECVNCTACIDVCDEVMDKVGRPRGLIRYDSYNGIKEGKRKIFTPRAYAYLAIWVVLFSTLSFLLANRSGIKSIILRAPGMLYQKVDEHHISNLYSFQITNKTQEDIPDVHFKLIPETAKLRLIGQMGNLSREKMIEGAFFIDMEKDKLEGRKNTVVIEIYSGNKRIDRVSTNFLGPLIFDHHKQEEEGDKDKKEEEHH